MSSAGRTTASAKVSAHAYTRRSGRSFAAAIAADSVEKGLSGDPSPPAAALALTNTPHSAARDPGLSEGAQLADVVLVLVVLLVVPVLVVVSPGPPVHSAVSWQSPAVFSHPAATTHPWNARATTPATARNERPDGAPTKRPDSAPNNERPANAPNNERPANAPNNKRPDSANNDKRPDSAPNNERPANAPNNESPDSANNERPANAPNNERPARCLEDVLSTRSFLTSSDPSSLRFVGSVRSPARPEPCPRSLQNQNAPITSAPPPRSAITGTTRGHEGPAAPAPFAFGR